MSKYHEIPIATLHNWFSKRGILRRLTLVRKVKTRDSYKIGLFVGMWAGDGSRSLATKGRYTVRFHFNSDDIFCHELVYDLIRSLFGSRINIVKGPGKKFEIKTYSKFIYKFLEEYLDFSNDKCGTVKLKMSFERHTKRFAFGFVKGLALTDGHFGKKFVFCTISKSLAKQFVRILKHLGWNPKTYVLKRANPKHRPLWMVRLRVDETKKFSKFLVLSERVPIKKI